MADFSVTVDLASIRVIAARLSPQRVSQISTSAMEESLAYLKGQVQDGIAVNTGVSRGSVFTEINGSPIDGLTGTVGSAQESVAVWEWGRRAGATPPPISAIQQWMHRRMGTTDRGVAFLIARAIGRRGLPAHNTFRNAASKGASVVQRIWVKHFGRL